MQLWMREREMFQVIPERNLEREYVVQRAESALHHVGAGASVGGEFPKFTAARSLTKALTPHVIVKFSVGDSGTKLVGSRT